MGHKPQTNGFGKTSRREGGNMTEKTLSADDRNAIYDLLGRLAWAFDTGDVEGIAGLFTEDGTMIQGSGDRFQGPEKLREFAIRAATGERAQNRQHVSKHLYVFPAGDGWTVRSFLQIFVADPESGAVSVRTMSYSDDTCVKTSAGWRIKERRNGAWFGDAIPKPGR
jgi:uncharacterized protein (TIGR02246 family)